MKIVIWLSIGLFLAGCASQVAENASKLGRFSVSDDLYLAHFDSKTDVDDIHSIAGVATMLKDERFAQVNFHAVAGAYGIQKGLYVPSPELFDLAFGKRWSDAHTDYTQALKEVAQRVEETLNGGGDIWIAEAGQSDFSADLVREIQNTFTSLETKKSIHIVQHSNWNEENTAPHNLKFVRNNTDYRKIPDGNAQGNGTPGLKSTTRPDLEKWAGNDSVREIWRIAFEIADKYNGKEGRYLNTAIEDGGMDFSDVAEACWIFGFDKLADTQAFFEEFVGM